MDYLELQQRANQIVSKVNNYEAELAKYEITEADILAEHKYADLYTLRAVMNLLFGSTVDQKCDRSLNIPTDLRLFASTVPMWNTTFNLIPKVTDNVADYEVQSDKHEFISDIDALNNYNLIHLDALENTVTTRDQRIQQGINYSYSSNIADALVTESQVANMFKWNTTDPNTIPNNTLTLNRQVPGIVVYTIGPDYDREYTSTIGYNPTTSKFNAVNYSNPSTYGSYYRLDDVEYSQYSGEYRWATQRSNFASCKIFMTGMNYTRGKLESPQQIWQPAERYGDDNLNYGFNRQGQATYHELVFKNRRKGLGTGVITEEVFDLSKFIVVGSPTITDNGIASGFSESSYITVYENANNQYSKLKINLSFTVSEPTNDIQSLVFLRGAGTQFNIGLFVNEQADKFLIRMGGADRVEIPINLNENYSISIEYDNSNWTVKNKNTGETYTFIYDINDKIFTDMYLGNTATTYTLIVKGSIDLKNFSITVDDEVVFKGTKEIDVEVQTDFTPAKSDIPDNDPQGLALRSVLAQQKDFYNGRPWFKELDALYGANMSKFASNINQTSKLGSGSGSFDRGKFNLIGSPTLSDTGILSNFSTENYLTIDIPPINTNSEIEITLPICNSTSYTYGSSYDPILGYSRSDGYGFNIGRMSLSETMIYSFTESSEHPDSKSAVLIGKQAVLKLSNNTIYLVVDNRVFTSTTLYADKILPTTLYIGKVTPKDSNTTFDLSPLRIVVDGVEVFTAKSVGETYMTDQDFYTNYKLTYDTYAESLSQPK